MLWDFSNVHIETLCPAWCKGLRHCFYLPYESHKFIPAKLSNTLPLFHEICKHFAHFECTCLFSSSVLVRCVVFNNTCIYDMGFTSVVTINVHSVCRLFGWSFEDLVNARVSVISDSLICRQYIQDLSDHDSAVAEFVRERILLGHIAVLRTLMRPIKLQQF